MFFRMYHSTVSQKNRILCYATVKTSDSRTLGHFPGHDCDYSRGAENWNCVGCYLFTSFLQWCFCRQVTSKHFSYQAWNRDYILELALSFDIVFKLSILIWMVCDCVTGTGEFNFHNSYKKQEQERQDCVIVLTVCQPAWGIYLVKSLWHHLFHLIFLSL